MLPRNVDSYRAGSPGKTNSDDPGLRWRSMMPNFATHLIARPAAPDLDPVHIRRDGLPGERDRQERSRSIFQNENAFF